MRKRSQENRLALWVNGQRVGVWTVSQGVDELAYDDDWVQSESARPMSLSLPFRPGNQPHRGGVVRAYFDNLLPDSQAIRERLARRFRATSVGAFDLLAEIGRDCVGALQILPLNELPGESQSIQARLMSESDVARSLHNSLALSAINPHDDDFRISIAGAQEKTALLWHGGQWWQPQGATPTSHILKLPLGLVGNMQLDLSHSVENEWLCSLLLEAFGLPVARSHPLVFEGQKVLVVERFDRKWAKEGSREWLLRLPQEDMCQATGTPAHAKYEAEGGPGIDRILEVLNGSKHRVADRETFFKAQLLFWMLCAPDGHAKNFSIALHAGGTYSLTPLYDVMSAYPFLGKGARQLSPHKVKMAMALRSKNAHWRMREIHRRHWLDLGLRHGIVSTSGLRVTELIEEVVVCTPKAIEQVAAKLPRDFPVRVANTIFDGLRAASGLLAN